tara:strand:+ start:10785 stop:12284 length:1500 start_codon:yes stop_codon:yes gene_type:complete
MANGRLSPLQMTDASAWKGLTTENHLGAIWQQSPQKVSDMIMTIQQNYFGNNIDSVLAQFPTLEFEDDRDFTWDLQSQGLDNVELVECRIDGTAITSVDAPGKNFTEFELVFGKNWFSDTERIVGELNEIYPVLVIEEPFKEGVNWVYRCRMDSGDPNLFLPYEEAVAGKRFSAEFAPVERTMSRKGRELKYKGLITMRQAFSQIRIQKKTPGNLSKKKMGGYFKDAAGNAVKFWQQYESFMFDNAFREDINKLMMFGTSNRSADGKYKIDGKSGYKITEGAGIRQQMETANTSYYNDFSIEELSTRLLDLSEGKLNTDQREFVLRTGERGAYEFHKSLEAYSQLFTPLYNQDRMYKKDQEGFQMGLGYGGQFIEYLGPNNIKVNLSVDSMYDDRNRNKLEDAKGGVTESYRYDIFDIGTTEGQPNIQRCGVTDQPIVHKYIPGLRNPFDPDSSFSAIGTAEDAWEEHKFYCGAAIVRDPSRTASFIKNTQAGYSSFVA